MRWPKTEEIRSRKTKPVIQNGEPLTPQAQEPDDLRRLPVDEVARRLIPDSPAELALVTGLTTGKDGRRADPWSGQREIANVTGIPEEEVAAHLDRLRARWRKSVPALTPVREDLAEILREHGRVLGARQLAAALLARRGAVDLDDAEERLLAAAVCVRAAVETEERRDTPKLVSRRASSGSAAVLIALAEAADEDQAPAPRAADLFAYAELLGEQADALSARDPLPGVTEIRQALRGVDIEVDHATRLSDTDLVLLAAAASTNTAATARLELYPRDLTAERALKISQAGSIADGVSDAELVRRVLARFPDLNAAVRPRPEDISRPAEEPRLRRDQGYRRPAPRAVEHPAERLARRRARQGWHGRAARHGRRGLRQAAPGGSAQAWRLRHTQDQLAGHFRRRRAARRTRRDPGERDRPVRRVPPRRHGRPSQAPLGDRPRRRLPGRATEGAIQLRPVARTGVAEPG